MHLILALILKILVKKDWSLIDFKNKNNAMILIYIIKLDFIIKTTNIGFKN